MSDIIYIIISLFKSSEEKRKNREAAKYREQYWEMRNLYNAHSGEYGKFKEIDALMKHAEKIYANSVTNMDYIPPSLKADAFPIQYRDRIMEVTQIPSASMSSGLLSSSVSLPSPNSFTIDKNGYPSTVHVPQLPPIEQYYAILDQHKLPSLTTGDNSCLGTLGELTLGPWYPPRGGY
jgi:hypothetical protein